MALGGTIRGTLKSGNTPLPGATVTATNPLTGQKVTGWTDVAGQYALNVPANGRYVVRAQMLAFAPTTGEALIDATNRNLRVDLDMLLQSRAQQAEQNQTAQSQSGQRTGQAGATAGRQRGFQSLSVTRDPNGLDLSAAPAADQAASSDQQSGGFANTATESVSFAGSASAATQFPSPGGGEEWRNRDQPGGGPPGGTGGGFNSFGGGFGGGPPGGGGTGGGPGGFFGGRGRPDFNKPHGTVYYSVGDSALNAAPYSLSGAPSSKPSYIQNRFGVAIGGPLNIPKIYHGGEKTFFFVNFNGSHSVNPFDAFSTVPTLWERGGDFSQTTILSRTGNGTLVPLPIQIFDPVTHLQFQDKGVLNVIPSARIDPAAAALLPYIPLPSLPGDTQNFHYLTSVSGNSNDLNVRLRQAIGKTTAGPRQRGPQNNINFGLHYHTSDNVVTNPFPSVGGTTSVRSIDIPVGYSRSFGKLNNSFRLDFNRNRIATRNLYAFRQNIASAAGIQGVSQNPFDWGLPSLSFTNSSSVQDTVPLLRRDQTLSFSDYLIWTHAKHTLRWGGDFRRIQLNTQTDTNARGAFIFTGANTSGTGNPTSGQGFDFADFLLGLPQQTSLQFGANNYHFRGNSWDLFAQDEWRVRGSLTLNLGLRYEYVSPLTELNNRIANLDLNTDFTSAALVLPGKTGPFTGRVPITLVRPDRNNLAPRLGIAWKPRPKTVLRAGYGINYNTGAYQGIVQQLAFQPPFSTTQTNIESSCLPLTLQNGFNTNQCPPPPNGLITNDYAVNPDYRLGYVQIWNADLQQEVTPTLFFNLGYNGTKGTRLDVLEAPNRSANGVRIPGVQPFLWETSAANSTAESGTLRVRKRLQHGFSMNGTYVFSKAIDNASSIGGGSMVVAQDAFNISAERGLSNFDQRHRLTADYLVELPFGHGKPWLSKNGPAQAVLGDWQWSGDWTFASGTPFTSRVLGNIADVNRGTNGTLRADLTGQPVALANPTTAEWFNTAAFVEPPTGTFGNARRNSIIGPPTMLFNMAFTKAFPMRDNRSLELRAQASNIFNTPQFGAIDTIVNSPSFGQVTSVGTMRTIQFTMRFRF